MRGVHQRVGGVDREGLGREVPNERAESQQPVELVNAVIRKGVVVRCEHDAAAFNGQVCVVVVGDVAPLCPAGPLTAPEGREVATITDDFAARFIEEPLSNGHKVRGMAVHRGV